MLYNSQNTVYQKKTHKILYILYYIQYYFITNKALCKLNKKKSATDH